MNPSFVQIRMTTRRLAVFISGNGSNLQAIIDAVQEKHISNTQIVLVVSNRKNAYGLTRAQNANIPTIVFPLKPYRDAGKSREDYDADLAQRVAEYQPDLVVLAGFMHILTPAFLDQFSQKVINLHPALPGQFDGAHAIERAYQAYQEGKINRTGIMVHYVIAAVDRGEVILKREIPIEPSDTLEQLEGRIHAHEHQLLVEAVQLLLNGPPQ